MKNSVDLGGFYPPQWITYPRWITYPIACFGGYHIVLRVSIFILIRQLAHKMRRLRVDYEGLKLYLRTTVARPIGDVACDNTDSICIGLYTTNS